MRKIILVMAVAAGLSSCATLDVTKTINKPQMVVNFSASDFTLSDIITAEISDTKSALLGSTAKDKSGNKIGLLSETAENATAGTGRKWYASIPVIGIFFDAGQDPTVSDLKNRLHYQIMQANPGYDVIFYPTYETSVSKNLFKTITTVKIKTRLGKLK